MNKTVLLILTAMLGLTTSGCTLFSKFADSTKELDENTVKPIPVKVSATPPSDQPEEEFADLEEEVEPLREIAGLIPATNPDVRVRSSVRGRNDPFSVVTLNPRIEIEQIEEKQPTNAISNRNDRFSNRGNQEENNNATLPEPEAIIEPTLAKEVFISGLYEANGRTKLIVQAPEESSSRYVEVGQYLSNGQVLVKRIEQDSFSSPVIILEESGMEVAVKVGEIYEAENSDLSFSPTAKPNSSSTSKISLNLN